MNDQTSTRRQRRVLILGANGRFGLAAAQAFDAAGWEVLAQVRRAPAAGMPAGARMVALPTTDIDGIDAHAAGADVVVHALNPKDYTLWAAELLPMARQRTGRIVCVGSVAGVLGNRGQVNYAAAKAALGGAVKSLAREMGSRGITANVVAPGVIAGNMSESTFAPEQIRALVPAARVGTPGEVAALVAFLCSDAAAYINGQVIGVNGGMV